MSNEKKPHWLIRKIPSRPSQVYILFSNLINFLILGRRGLSNFNTLLHFLFPWVAPDILDLILWRMAQEGVGKLGERNKKVQLQCTIFFHIITPSVTHLWVSLPLWQALKFIKILSQIILLRCISQPKQYVGCVRSAIRGWGQNKVNAVAPFHLLLGFTSKTKRWR